MSPVVILMSSVICVLLKVDESIGEINAPVLFFYPHTRGEGGCVMQ